MSARATRIERPFVGEWARPTGAGNTGRPLTRSTSTTPKEGLAMKATRPKTHDARSPRWLGHPRQYQAEAIRLFSLDRERSVMPWSYITTGCDVDLCLDTKCMTLHSPKRLDYAPGVCVYCGLPSGTRDHLLPEPMTGLALRHIVLTVPACTNCNSRIGDFPSANIGERRRRAQESIQRTNKHLLERPEKTEAALAELGRTLRSVAIKNNLKAAAVRSRLAWPADPLYDIKAFQRAGVEDPVALGMCEATAKPLRPDFEVLYQEDESA